MATLPIDRTAKAVLDANLVNGILSDGPKLKSNDDNIYDTFDLLYSYTNGLVSAGTLSKLGVINVKDYGASGSANTYTGSITSGSQTLMLTTSSHDFVAGQGISIPGAGAAAETLVTTVSAVNGAVITVSVAASTTASAVTVGHDDTAAIQAALNVLVAGSGELNFPTGIYKLNSAITVAILANKKVKIRGIGRVEVISTVTEPGAEAGIFNFTGTSTSSLEIENIIITHNAVAVGILDGFSITNFKNLIMRNVSVTKASMWGGHITSVLSGLIENCSFDDNRYGGFGIESCGSSTTALNVIGGEYNSNGTTAPTDGYGISCKTSSGVINQNIRIVGIIANSNLRKGIDIHNGHNIVIDGNFVTGFQSAGIYAVAEDATKDVKDITIVNNHVDGTGATFAVYGIYVGAGGTTTALDSGSFQVKNNKISNTNYVGSSAIFVSNVGVGLSPKNVNISGNEVTNGCDSTSSIILFNNQSVRIGTLIMSGNDLHSTSATYGINIPDSVSTVTLTDNTITIDSGTVTYGIQPGRRSSLVANGNQLLGGATYTTAILVFDASLGIANANFNKTLAGNSLNALALPDYKYGGRSIQYASDVPVDTYYIAGSIVYFTSLTTTPGRQCSTTGWRVTTAWTLSTAYALNTYRVPTASNGFVYKATTAGTSAGTEPTWPTTIGATVTDGTVVWTNVGVLAVFKLIASVS